MKRIIMALIAFAVALTFAGCSEPAADVKWTLAGDISGGATSLHDIKWVNSGKTDQQWSELLDATGESTSTLGVTELTGIGEGVGSDGQDWEISVDAGSTGVKSTSGLSVTLEDGATADLQITSAAKK